MLKYLVFLGAIAQIVGIADYIKDTCKGKTKPNRVTWLFWAIFPLMGYLGAWIDGAGWENIPILTTGFASLLVFLSSFLNKQAYWKLGKYDYICGFFAFLGLILWWISKEPMLVILFAIIGDAFAAIPTLIKAWKSPNTESKSAYWTSLFSSITTFFAISQPSFSNLAFPIYLIFANSIILTFLYKKLDPQKSKR